MLIDWFAANGVALLNVIMIDVVLAGDNAIIVGLAASQVAPEHRARVIFWGIAGAVVLRIAFAAVTAQLLAITGLTFAGGVLLLFVCWKMYKQIQQGQHNPEQYSAAALAKSGAPAKPMTFRAAVVQIILADVTMSLDNVLAVAGAAKGNTLVLVIGLAVAVVLMAVASHYIASLLGRYPWITWIGLLVILWVALSMMWQGWNQIESVYPSLWSGPEIWKAITGH
jgi:YjbE family integral membrane protein